MDRISAVIITQNEERNIARCLASLKGIADEVVVVDSGSTDQTKEICCQAGVVFQHHPWEGYSLQKNYAQNLATGSWILSLDADEALSDRLRKSLLQLKNSEPTEDCVYSFHRLTNYCGHWIRHCGWYPDEKVRLWHKDMCQWEGVVHEELKFRQKAKRQTLTGDLLHYSYYSIEELAARQMKYAALAAQKAYLLGKRPTKGALIAKPMWTFLRNYFFKGGFLDGYAGYEVCRMTALYTLLKYARLKELTKTESDGERLAQKSSTEEDALSNPMTGNR